MFKRIDHFELIPQDLDQTLDFYTNILHFHIKHRIKLDNPDINEIVFLELNNTILELVGAKNPTARSTTPWQVGYCRIAIEVEDMDQAITYLQSKNVPISVPPMDLGTSTRAEILDPNGLSVELRHWHRD